MEYKGVEADMLEALKGKVLYIDEGDSNTPFSGTLDTFGENFIRFTDVATYRIHFSLSQLGDMRKALEENDGEERIPVLYKNKNDIATLVELYQE